MPPNLIHLSHMEQKHDADCLAMCVDMVLLHIGQRKPRRRLHRLLKTDVKDGTPFPNVRNVRRLGFTMRYYDRATFEIISAELAQQNPCIVPVRADEFSHWPSDERTQHAVVIVALDDEHVWIHDPDQPIAPILVPIGDFDLAWLGMSERLAVILP